MLIFQRAYALWPSWGPSPYVVLILWTSGLVFYGSWMVEAPFCTLELLYCSASCSILVNVVVFILFCLWFPFCWLGWWSRCYFRLPCLYSLSMEFCFPVLDPCVQFWLVLYLPAAVCICNDVRFPEKMELCRAAVFQLCEHYVGLLESLC
jgi:hypothetical protein